MTISYKTMDNTTLLTLGAMGKHDARVEILKRHIMSVDNCSYADACETCRHISIVNHKGMYLLGLPFQTSLFLVVMAGFGSIPLVFHLPSVELFNTWFVTTDHPPLSDLETPLEVSIWSWNWMEPQIGTFTFVLMCMQYMRINLDHLGFKPYTFHLKRWRGERLARSFPQYDSKLLMRYSHTATIYNVEGNDVEDTA